MGRLIEFKGFHDLIAACHLLRQRGVAFSCKIAGEGPLAGRLAEQAAGLNQPGASVTLTGLLTQEEVGQRMAACDVFALACCVDEKGACDVLPTVILEAMAAGRTVVSTRLAAIPEMVDFAQTGLLVPPENPTILANVLEKLATKREELRRMGLAGRCRVETHFSAAASARRLGELFADANHGDSQVGLVAGSSKPSEAIFCLFDRWPLAKDLVLSGVATLVEPIRDFPPIRWAALRPGDFKDSEGFSLHPASAEVLRRFEYLPDDVVYETYWRQEAATAHLMESWRGEIGGACEPEVFFLACRRVLYLDRTLLARRTALHLHAVGPQALLCAWLLRRLGAVDTVSFLLLPTGQSGPGIAGSTLRRLAPEFAGGWIVRERKLAASLGENFHADLPSSDAWLNTLQRWARPRNPDPGS